MTFGLYVHAQTCMCTKYTYVPIHTHKWVKLGIRVLNKIPQVRRQIFHFLSYVEPRFYTHTHTPHTMKKWKYKGALWEERITVKDIGR